MREREQEEKQAVRRRDPRRETAPLTRPSPGPPLFGTHRAAQHRRQRQAQRVWEKGTATAPVASPTKAELRHSVRGRRHAAAASDPPVPAAGRGGREDMGNFVSKKREMFFVQMSLDIKRDEIRKVLALPRPRPHPGGLPSSRFAHGFALLQLDERARVKDEALRKSERMLEEVRCQPSCAHVPAGAAPHRAPAHAGCNALRRVPQGERHQGPARHEGRRGHQQEAAGRARRGQEGRSPHPGGPK